MIERIEQLCTRNGTNITSLCKEITGSSGNLQTWRKGNIRNDYLIKIAQKFKVSTDYLLGETDNPLPIKNDAPKLRSVARMQDVKMTKEEDEQIAQYIEFLLAQRQKKRSIQLYFLPASAGDGAFLDSNDFDTVEVGSEVPQSATFGVRISGDSMKPDYPDGCIAWVQITPSIQDGQIGVFILDGEGYIKQQGQNELISLNPQYAPLQLNEYSNIRTCGLVVGVTNDLK